MDDAHIPPIPGGKEREGKDDDGNEKKRQEELLALFRLLVRKPPPGHDLSTSPICKKHGIREI
jgi:hypothetical protein